MDARKIEKITALLISAMIVCLSFSEEWDWQTVGIYAGSNMLGRLLYPFFHANTFHALLNSWCLLSVVFIYDIGIGRLLSAYMIAVFVPVDTLGYFMTMDSPTVGLSGMVFALFGSISFEVLRKRYYQSWMIFYLAAGFLLPNTNAVLHLWCYVLGLIMALLNKPVKIMHHER
jgi:membrane associated rhomboid family serine protease|nr:MAG TPA: GlpG-like protein [Caudoviricetes sp.]